MIISVNFLQAVEPEGKIFVSIMKQTGKLHISFSVFFLLKDCKITHAVLGFVCLDDILQIWKVQLRVCQVPSGRDGDLATFISGFNFIFSLVIVFAVTRASVKSI